MRPNAHTWATVVWGFEPRISGKQAKKRRSKHSHDKEAGE